MPSLTWLLGNIKQELEESKKLLNSGRIGGLKKSYNKVAKERRKENVVTIKPKTQQKSESI